MTLKALSRSITAASLPAGIVMAIAIVGSAFTTASIQRTISAFLVDLIVVVGLQVFMGNSGVVNLGHAAIMGIAAYTVGILATPAVLKSLTIPDAPLGLARVELNVVLAAVIGIGVAAIVGALVGMAITRQSGIAAVMGTLAFLIIVHVVLTNWISLTGGPRAFFGVPVRLGVLSLAALGVLAIVVARVFKDSVTGLHLRSSREDLLAAAAVGVSVRQVRLVGWIVSTAIIATGGVALALFLGTLDPDSFYFRTVFATLAMLLLGGMRSVSGAVVGTIVIACGTELMRYLEGGPDLFGVVLPRLFGLPQVFLGATIVIVMAIRPDGIMGDRELDELIFGRGTAEQPANGVSGAVVESKVAATVRRGSE
jgi:branched-chain amino acid transport system permease protein